MDGADSRRFAIGAARSVMADPDADREERSRARAYLYSLGSYAGENKAGPLSDAQQSADYRLSRDPLAEGDVDVSDPRWQRLTGHTPADEAERNQQGEARGFVRFAGLGAAGELATPLVARGVGSAVNGARDLMAPRPVVVRDPAAVAPVEAGPPIRFPRRGDFYVPRDGDMGPDLFKNAETASSLAPTKVIEAPPKMSVVAPEMGSLNADELAVASSKAAEAAATLNDRAASPIARARAREYLASLRSQ